MNDDKDDLPSDREDGGLKPQKPGGGQRPAPPPDDEKVEKDPSEQPS